MGATSNIEWTDATWTPIRARRFDGKLGVHCEKVSPACKNCYAERLNKRNLPAHGTGLDFTILNRENVEIIVDDNMILQPLRWKRGRRIFVCSQTDLFGSFVEEWQIAEMFAVMALAHWHTFQVLTKRPERMQKLLSSDDFWESVEGGMSLILEEEVDPLERKREDLRATAPEPDPDTPLANVWLGVTAENQEWASKRIPALLATPAAKRFVSCEPLLGSIDLNHSLGGTKWIGGQRGCGGTTKGIHYHDDRCGKGIDWVIVGGESGPGARPMHPEWARSLRNQCRAAGVPFFFKQWGEFADLFADLSITRDMATEEIVFKPSGEVIGVGYRKGTFSTGMVEPHWAEQGGAWMGRVGKKAAGRYLDSLEWNEVPE